MVKFILILLQIIFVTNSVLPMSVEPSKEFIHIGSFKSGQGGVQGRGITVDENDYYISMNSATWSAAKLDCTNILGADATLLAIESEEECNYLAEALEGYGGITTYWTSDMYDGTAKVWRWSANNNPLPPFSPWAANFPTANPNALLRVLLSHTSRYSASWSSASNTQLQRYICEIQRTTVAVPCYKTNDLVVVLDSSGSILAPNFEVAKGFVDKLASAFVVHKPSRLSFITYSTTAIERIDITNILTPAAVSSTIVTTYYDGGGTNTNIGIDLAIAQFNSSPRQVPLNLVVLTDGYSNVPASTIASANQAAALGIRTFSVGIGSGINQQELISIAAGDSTRVYNAANFDELIKLLTPLSLKICPNV